MLKKIRVEDLEIGMYVEDFNTPWLQHPFLRSRRQIRSAKEIDIVLAQGIGEVVIDTSKGKDSGKARLPEENGTDLLGEGRADDTPAPSGAGADLFEEPSAEIPFEQELRQAQQLYEETKRVLQRLFEDARLGRAIDAEAARAAVEKMIQSTFRNRDALLSLVRLKAFDAYTFHHSLNVTLLCLGLGSQLGILDSELLRLGMGALLHDLGKVALPEHLIRKEGPLDPREFEVMKTHPAHGAKIILRTESIPDECAGVALNHHERYDASGYPRGLVGNGIGKFGLIAAIADVYDAMTSDRPYQRAMTGHEALKRAYQWAGTLFHPVYVRKFIQCLGIYPVGSVVRLDSGEIGVVCRPNRDQPLRPWVRLIRSRDGRPPEHPEDWDLRLPDPASGKGFARSIERVLEPQSAGAEVEKLLAPGRPASRRLTVVLGKAPPAVGRGSSAARAPAPGGR